MGAQLTQLASLSVVASEVMGPDGRPVPASELLGSLPALSRLTRLTSLKVEGRPPAGQEGSANQGVPAGDVLRALPPGAPLKQVGPAWWDFAVRLLGGLPGWGGFDWVGTTGQGGRTWGL